MISTHRVIEKKAHHVIPEVDQSTRFTHLHKHSADCPCSPTLREDMSLDDDPDELPLYLHNPIQ